MYATMDKKTDTDKLDWVDWLIAEREKQDITQADLAKKSDLSRVAISDYERRQRPNPDVKALVKISRALGYPAEHLPRIAGLLPPAEVWEDDIEAIAHEANQLNDQDRQEVLAYIRMKKNLRKKNGG